VKRGAELCVEAENSLNVVGFLAFGNIDINSVTFPESQELDVMPGDAVVGCRDSNTFL
jgi:hypothetical protein